MKRVISLLLVIPSSSLVMSVTSLSLMSDTNIAPGETVFKITNPFTMFNPNDTYTFSAEYVMSDSNEDKVLWTSSNPSVGTIDENGNFTAVAEGTTKITATLDQAPRPTDSIEVSVSSQYRKITFNNMGTKAMTTKNHDMMDNDGNPFEIRFESAFYSTDKTKGRPIHNELKPTDIEIFSQDQNITAQCPLSHNKLTIPAEYTDNPVTINYLGAEIADWITWYDIHSISDKDLDDENHDLIQNYFSLGDYKKVYQNGMLFSHARIIDFYHDEAKVQSGSVYKLKPVPTTWEMYENAVTNEWGCTSSPGPEYVTFYYVQPWSDSLTVLRRACVNSQFDDLSTRECIKTSEGNSNLKTYDTFFVGSYTEYTGLSHETDRKTSKVDADGKVTDGTLYAYYDVNKYKCSLTIEERRKKTSESSVKYYFTRLPWSKTASESPYDCADHVILIDLDSGNTASVEQPNLAYLAFLMFGI